MKTHETTDTVRHRALAMLNECRCGHPWVDHCHGGLRSTHCLHRDGCRFSPVDCDPCGCDEFKTGTA